MKLISRLTCLLQLRLGLALPACWCVTIVNTSVDRDTDIDAHLAEAVPLIFGNVVGLALPPWPGYHAHQDIRTVRLQYRPSRPRLLLCCVSPADFSAVPPADHSFRSFASFIGFGTNFIQERMYRSHVAKRGPEARLYASLVGGLVFPAGAFILAFSQGRGHWMGPIVGLTMVRHSGPDCTGPLLISLRYERADLLRKPLSRLAGVSCRVDSLVPHLQGVYTIYLAVFSYLADCYTIVSGSFTSAE